VLQWIAASGKLLIEGVGMVKRHTRPNPQTQIKGGIAERESPIAISNVMLLTPAACHAGGLRVEGTATRVRVAQGRRILDKK
jgi:large subunit ribosomal protein L24